MSFDLLTGMHPVVFLNFERPFSPNEHDALIGEYRNTMFVTPKMTYDEVRTWAAHIRGPFKARRIRRREATKMFQLIDQVSRVVRPRQPEKVILVWDEWPSPLFMDQIRRLCSPLSTFPRTALQLSKPS